MSFLSDLVEGHWSNLGTDISHAPSSLAKHPSELYETIGGLAAGATGGLALGLLPELGAGAGALGGIGDLFGGAAAADVGAGEALAPLAEIGAGGGSDVAAGATGIDQLLAGTGIPGAGTGVVGGGLPGAASAAGEIAPIASSTSVDLGAGAAGAGSAAGAAPAAAASDPGLLASLGLTPAKALGVGAAGLGLGYNMLQGQKPLADQQALQTEATQLSAQGQQFMKYLQQGKLPAGLQTLVDKQTNAAKAMAIANAAKNGQSTDPTQNTQLADAINNANQQATSQVALIAEQLFKQGLDETQVSTQIMQYLTNLDEQQTQNMGKAIASFASSLAGGPTFKQVA